MRCAYTMVGLVSLIFLVTVSNISRSKVRELLASTSAGDAASKLMREEQQAEAYKQRAARFWKAARVAEAEVKDAHRKGPVDTLRDASERLDMARGHILSSSADKAAMLRLSSSLRAYSQALLRHEDGLEFEAPDAYKQLSDFELRHPSSSTSTHS